MGSHHLLGGSTGPGRKMSLFVLKFFCIKNKNNSAIHHGPVQPACGEGSPLIAYLINAANVMRIGHFGGIDK